MVTLSAQSSFWSDITEQSFAKKGVRQIIPQQYRTVQFNIASFKKQMTNAPKESSDKSIFIKVALPMPNGTTQHFKVVESPIMEAGLAAKFPEIKTYLGQGIEDPTATVRFDWTHKGFHAMVLSAKGSVFIDPYSSLDSVHYIVYYKKDFSTNKTFQCQIDEQDKNEIDVHDGQLLQAAPVKSAGDELRTYRLALACTGEYAQFHGGTVNGAMSAMVTSMNRVNGIYEREVSIRMILIANNNLLIYLNGSTDPYTNNSGFQMLGQNQSNINSVIGSANYDIGHVFSTGGGGIASLQSPCSNNSKARGVTGLGAPIGDPFDVDYVCHEMGHQFGGNHTFNGNTGSCSGGNRNGSTAYEPGSATTIMGYAGICGSQNIQSNSDPYFHTISFDEMTAFSINGNGNSCATVIQTGNNEPNVNAGTGGYVIPISTPFELIGSATDPDGDPLTYCWEQFNTGPAGHPNSPTGNAPLFRSFSPVNTPARTFPRIQDIINNTQTIGEILPSYTRPLNFRLTARDNKAGGGGVSYDGISFQVSANAGPFLVTQPNTNTVTWLEGAPAEITWDVANTDAAPINCQFVDILLSTDGGFTYPHTIASNVANDGNIVAIVPQGTATTQARVRVQCATNIFFDISNQNFTITAPTAPDYFLYGVETKRTVCAPDDAQFKIWTGSLLGFTDAINFSVANAPAGVDISFNTNPVTPGDTLVVTITNTQNATTGGYPITLEANSSSSNQTTDINFTVFSQIPSVPTLVSPIDGENAASFTPILEWELITAPHTYDVQVASDPLFATIIDQASGLSTNTYIAQNLSSYQVYYWRVRANNQCTNGEYGQAYAFRTASVDCDTASGSQDRVFLAAIAITYSSTLDVTIDEEILDLNVINVEGEHASINELSMSLESPSGTSVALLPRICGNEDDFNISFDDDAQNANYPCPPTDGNRYQPVGQLASFNGENSMGQWLLKVTDHESGNGGRLNNWALEICKAAQNDNDDPILVNNDSLKLFIGESQTISSELLLATDGDNTASDLEFLIIEAPAYGELQLNGQALTAGSTFTQADIDNGSLAYLHQVSGELNDRFRFNVNDGQGGWFGNPYFNILAEEGETGPPITPVNGTTIIYPNPTVNTLNIGLFVDNAETVRVYVFDGAARLTHEMEVDVVQGNNYFELNTQKLAGGVYFLKIIGNSVDFSDRFIVIK